MTATEARTGGLWASRLAAAAHLRQTRILSRLQSRLRSLRAKAGELVGRLAREAADLGMAGLPRLSAIIRRELDELRNALEGLLEEFARTGYEMSREMLVKSLGAKRLLALINRAVMTEAEEPTDREIVARYQLAGIPPEELEAYVKSLLFPPPDAETVGRWLVEKPPGGLSWEERFWRWAVPAQSAFLTQLTQGLAAGENPTQLEKRIRPFADGLFYKSERIARTEAVRVAERANRATAERMGPYLEGLQIVAVMDEWTRPAHAARHGRIFYRGDDGVYRAENGDVLPDLPDEPNCRCMTIPVLKMPPELRAGSPAGEAFRTATGGLIPDPASYAEWWEKASPKEQRIAVGAGRWQTMRDILQKEPIPRNPEWADFIDEQGRLLPIDVLRAESPQQREQRLQQVRRMLAERERLFQQVASRGFTGPGPSDGGGRPDEGPSAGGPPGQSPSGGGRSGGLPPTTPPPGPPSGQRPDWHLLQQLDLGPPKDVKIACTNKELVLATGKELFGKELSDQELTRLAGAIDRADLLVQLEGGGLRLETRRSDARIVRWVGPDAEGRLKVEFYRIDIQEAGQKQGLATRSLTRCVHQAALLGVEYAEAQGTRSPREGGYYYLARCGFNAPLPKEWLETYQEELRKLGIKPQFLADLMQSPEGRELWRLHGQTIECRMNLTPNSPDLIQLWNYLQERAEKGRPMAEDRHEPEKPYDPDEIVGYDSAVLGWITRADEEAWDRAWEKRTITEEERQRWKEIFANWRPGSRQETLPPEVEALRQQLEKEGRLGEVTITWLP